MQVEYEISALKRLSGGHRNVVTLYDYVEVGIPCFWNGRLTDKPRHPTTCTFSSTCAAVVSFLTGYVLRVTIMSCTWSGLVLQLPNSACSDAAKLVRTIMKAVQHIHNGGVVHRDLKPENLLFRTPAEDADIMIADFGLSRVMEEDGSPLLTDVNGTTSYMAPEIFKKSARYTVLMNYGG
jgi:calcium/calmodulin-dependent protein kinase I